MAKTFLSLLSLLLSLSFLPLPSLSTDDTFVYGGCSQIKFIPDSPYESNLNSLLASMLNSATYSSYNKFTLTGSGPQDIVYGLYQCRGDMSMPDCATCVAHSVSRLRVLCQQTCGGAVQLEGCFVKYDNISFIGEEDKEVVTKKCGPLIGGDADLINRRDAVMASLGGSGGLYRVGGAGDVQGVAQCTGDLSVSDCQDCVTEAIGRLKGECGGAVFGDMFLGKCYARYSTNGAHVYSKSDHDDSHDDAEKTFAIIIGLFAVVALIIIFLTFMRKVAKGNGK
ncbi:hypothetical protein LguiA_013756 [Lonicera macranthoides]